MTTINRVAVIGLGKMGLLHASLVNVVPDVKLVAVCEKSRIISRFSRNAFTDVKIVTDTEDLSQLQIDTIYVTTPTSTHYSIISAIIEQNICKNIFVEKPLSNSAVESARICELIKKSGNAGIYMVGYNRRFNVTFRKAMELIGEGTLGQLLNFTAYAFSSDFLVDSPGKKRVNRGGVLRDLGCHAIDLAGWFTGNIKLDSIQSSKVSPSGVLDSASFTVLSQKGIKGQIKASWREPNYRLPEIGLVIEGSKGYSLTVNDDKVELQKKQGDKTVWHKQDLKDNTHFMLGGTDYYREDEEYMNAVKSGNMIEPDFSTALKVDELIDSVENAVTGQPRAE
jgi:predicted dehydrogenase